MSLRTYVIAAEPGRPPTFRLMGPDGVPRVAVPADCVPPEVSRHAAWLSALADGRPLPAGDPPPAVFAPTPPERAFIAVVTTDGA